ncbi:hypothetical protein N9299_07720, partial [Amylibacter sp.]|nr:hypothetical protein [Amylibacter sp.]
MTSKDDEDSEGNVCKGLKSGGKRTDACNEAQLNNLINWVKSGFAGTDSCTAQILLLNIAVEMDGKTSTNGWMDYTDCRSNALWRHADGITCLEYAEQPQPEGSFAAYLAAHFSVINNEAVKAKEVQDAAILQAALEEAAIKKAAEEKAAE